MQPIGGHLEAALSDSNSDTKKINGQLDRLSVLVSSLKMAAPRSASQPNLVLSLVSQCWPFFEQIVQRFGSENKCAEKLCRLYKHTLRSVKHEFEPLLSALMQQLAAAFEHTFRSSYLYCASICVTEFSNKAEYAEPLFGLIGALSQSAFKRFNSVEGFTNNPDVVEEYFYLCSRMINYCSKPIMSSDLLGEMVRCAIVGMQVHHRDANKGVLNFLENVAGFIALKGAECTEAEKRGVERAIAASGEGVVGGICKALMGDSPLFYLDVGSGSLAGVLFKLMQLCPQMMEGWLNSGFQKAQSVGTESLREPLVRGISGCGGNRAELNRVVRGFHDECWRVKRNQSGGGQ